MMRSLRYRIPPLTDFDNTEPCIGQPAFDILEG